MEERRPISGGVEGTSAVTQVRNDVQKELAFVHYGFVEGRKKKSFKKTICSGCGVCFSVASNCFILRN